MDDKKSKKNNNKTTGSATSLSTMLLQGLQAPAKLVRLYQVNKWPQDATVPDSPEVLINLMGEVEQWHSDVIDNHKNTDGTSSDHPNRVVVLSCDGTSRVGVYCAAFTAVEQVKN
jgi:hypothetical protein